MPKHVAILECYRWYLAHKLLQALPPKRVPEGAKPLRVELDMGM